VVLDSRGRVPLSVRVFDVAVAPTLVATVAMPTQRVDELRARGVDVVEVVEDRDGHVDVGALLDVLGRRGLLHVLVEGGAAVHGSFVEARAIDAVWAVVAPVIVGGAGAPGPVGGRGVARMAEAMRLADVNVVAAGDDIVIRGTPMWSAAPRDDNRTAALLAAPAVGIPTPPMEA
ncbi:MAG: dihydrofolate reductase family protein, partial [Ardenticatenales bacterium]